jgi:hypothetical protein
LETVLQSGLKFKGGLVALAKQILALPIDKGLDTKLDPKQEEIGYLRTAQNIVYETVKMLRKRNGYIQVDAYDEDNVVIENPIRTTKLKNELLLFTDTNLYSYSETRERFINKGSISSVSPSERTVIKNANNQSQVDGLTLQGFNIFTWTDSSGGVRYSVQDVVNNSFLVSNALVEAGAERPVLAHIEGDVYIIYGNGANVKYKSFSVLQPSTLSTATVAASDRHLTLGLIDAEQAGNSIIVAYNSNNGGNDLTVFFINSVGVPSSLYGVTAAAATHALDVMVDAASRVVLTFSNGANLSYIIFPVTLAASLIPKTLIETIANVTTCCATETSTGVYTVHYEVSVAGTGMNYIKTVTTDSVATVGTPSVFKRSVGLGARSFVRNGVLYIPTVLDSEIQSSYFVFNSTGSLVTKFANQTAGGVVTYGVLQPVLEAIGDSYMVPLIIHNRVQSEGNSFFSTDGIAAGLLNFEPEFKFSNAQLAECLHICSGVLKLYDGASVTEHGFHVFPEELEQASPITVSVETLTEGVLAVKDVQKLTYVGTPASGSMTLTIGAETTGAIQWNDSNANIKAAIEALTAIVTVTVTGDFSAGHTITFDDPIQDISQIIVATNSILTGGAIPVTVTPSTVTQGVAAVKEVQKLTFSAVPTVGSFKLDIDTEVTTAINFSQAANDVKLAIEALASITTVTVTGDFSTGFTITFDAPVEDIVTAIVLENSLDSALNPGLMTDGTYGYAAVYRWTDNTGRDHRSTPTLIPLSVVLNAGTDTQATNIKVPTLRVTDKTNVVIELYRTEANGVTYYKTTDDLSPIFNDPTVDSITITDTRADSDLISNQILYTTGGVLENIPAPASFQIATYTNDRLVVASEKSNRIFFSKQVTEGSPVEFTDAIYRDVDPVGGYVSTLAPLNEKLIIFTRDACFFVSGDGPNNAGLQDTMNKAEVISSDIGCIAPDSTVLTPLGLLFKSRKGIWKLGPGLGLEYVGARVEGYNSEIITSAQVVGELNQIRFTLDTDLALVYNYQLDKWATFDNHGARSAIVIGNDYYYLREDGVLYKEDRSTFADAGSPIKMKIETGWMSFSELQGIQRAYHAMILATFKSAHKIRVKVAYDFEDAYTQEVLIDTSTFVDAPVYGEDATYGDSSPYGGSGALEQMRVDFKRQKCQSVKLLIEDAQSTTGEGLSLSGITLRVGGKTGTNKIAADRKFGTS